MIWVWFCIWYLLSSTNLHQSIICCKCFVQNPSVFCSVNMLKLKGQTRHPFWAFCTKHYWWHCDWLKLLGYNMQQYLKPTKMHNYYRMSSEEVGAVTLLSAIIFQVILENNTINHWMPFSLAWAREQVIKNYSLISKVKFFSNLCLKIRLMRYSPETKAQTTPWPWALYSILPWKCNDWIQRLI